MSRLFSSHQRQRRDIVLSSHEELIWASDADEDINGRDVRKTTLRQTSPQNIWRVLEAVTKLSTQRGATRVVHFLAHITDYIILYKTYASCLQGLPAILSRISTSLLPSSFSNHYLNLYKSRFTYTPINPSMPRHLQKAGLQPRRQLDNAQMLSPNGVSLPSSVSNLFN